jgi:hypothetical protein
MGIHLAPLLASRHGGKSGSKKPFPLIYCICDACFVMQHVPKSRSRCKINGMFMSKGLKKFDKIYFFIVFLLNS